MPITPIHELQIHDFKVFHNFSVITYNFKLDRLPAGVVSYRIQIVGSDRILDHGVLTATSEIQTLPAPYGIDPQCQYLLTITRNKVTVSRSTTALTTLGATTSVGVIRSQSSAKLIGPFKFTGTDQNEATLIVTIPNCDCWSLHVVLTKGQYALLQKDNAIRLRAMNDSNNKITTSDWWLTPVSSLNTSPLSQGYAACRFPIRPKDDAQWITGTWKARLFAGYAFPFKDLENMTVYLCVRTVPPYPQTLEPRFRLPIKFIFFGQSRVYEQASVLLNGAILDALCPQYLKMGITLDFDVRASIQPGGGSRTDCFVGPPPDAQSYIADYYALADTISPYLSQSDASDVKRLHVFIFTDLTIPNGAGSGVGMSMRPGPQGFFCAQAGPLIRFRYTEDEKTKIIQIGDGKEQLGLRMAHEIGHYLGLSHESACLGKLDNKDKPTATNMGLCDDAIVTKGTNEYQKYVRNNMMYTINAGLSLEPEQVAIARTAPLVQLEVSDDSGKTPITSAQVRIQTGHGIIQNNITWDGPGTNDDVYITLVYRRSDESWYEQTTFLNYAVWDDFEAGQDWTYNLDVSKPGYREDLESFDIYKKAQKYIFADDAWLLGGLTLTVNGTVVYRNPSIDRWISSNSNYDNHYSRTIPKTPSTNIVLDQVKAPGDVIYIAPFLPEPTRLKFGGTSNCYVTIPNWIEVEASGPQITLQAWVYVTSITSPMTVISSGTLSNMLFLDIGNNSYQVGIISGGNSYVAGMTIPTSDINKWIHLCGTYDGLQWTIYRNSMLGGQTPGPSLLDQVTGDLTFGVNGNQNADLQWSIRNVCIWKIARSVSQISKDLYTVDVYDSNIAGYWAIDEASGTLAGDDSVGGNDGTITNPDWDQPEHGIVNCLYCTSQSGASYGQIQMNDKMYNFKDDLTIAAWIKTGATDSGTMTGEKFIIGSSQCGLRILGNKYTFGLISGSIGQSVSIAIENGDIGQWVHLCGQYSSTARQWILYKNGFQVASQSGTGYGSTLNTDWAIGGRPGLSSASYSLQIRMVWVFTSAFTTEITQTNLQNVYMNSEIDAPLPTQASSDGLNFLWSLSQGVSSYFVDRSNVLPLANGKIDNQSISWGKNERFVSLFVNSPNSIQSVINSITDASDSKQYTIFLSAGSFSTDSSINLPPWISIVGTGTYLTDLNLGDSAAFTMATGSQVRQLSLYCVAVTSTLIGVLIQNSKQVFVDSVYVNLDPNNFDRPTLQCITSTASEGVKITNSDFEVTAVTNNQGPTASFSGGSVNVINSTLNSAGEPTISTISNNRTSLFNCGINLTGGSSVAMTTDSTSYLIAAGCTYKGSYSGNVTIN